ncbi:universal stress protein [Paenisporosarcina cavernae]|uniref:Universal stress protein n=1 Tax=Paenisporosarcina cavernae TaxID=2320858 RepID=A0A385YV78_9BACL|nr:universal stress protein [Paenisporosarcina cavernae]AYC30190.1 universal stress protein [Paenisporosarcina cavernae]
MFDKLLVGYDGSEGSRHALTKAIELTNLHAASHLTVAYINEDVVGGDLSYSNQQVGSAPILTEVSTPPPLPETNPDSPLHFAREYAEQMKETIEQQLVASGVQHYSVVAIDGHPARALTDLAEQEEMDAIVVGNSGKSGIQKFFLGSVSEKIVKDSPCTVIVIK